MNNSLDRVSRKVLERFTDLLGFVVSLKVVCVFFAVALASTLNAQDSDAEVVDAAFASALTVDGNASDWANLSSGVVTMDTSIRGDNGTLAVDIRYAWDDTNMYILVQENSNGALSTNAQEAANGDAYLKEFWLFDCIAFWIDLDNTSGTEVNGNIVAAGNADFQPWFGFSSSGRTDLIYGRANNTGDQNLDGLENGKVATGGTFAAHNRTIEVAIAWADIAATVGSDRQPGGDLESVIAPGYIFGSDPLLLNNDYEGQAFIGPEQYEAPSGTDSDSRDIRLVAQDSDAAPPKPDNGWVFSDQAGETAAPTFGDAGGTLSGGVTWDTDDPFGSGGSVSFDGTDGTVVMEDLAEAFNGLANFSFSIWIKSNATGIDKGFWEAVDSGGGDLWGLRYDSTGATAGGSNVIKLGITTSESGGNTNSGADQQESHEDTQTTEWQNIVMTWEDGEGFNLYLDGELDEPTSEMQTTSGTLEMMDRFVLGDGAKAYWDGLIDEVAVWSSTLSADDAAWLSKNSIAKLVSQGLGDSIPYVSKLRAGPGGFGFKVADEPTIGVDVDSVVVSVDGSDVDVAMSKEDGVTIIKYTAADPFAPNTEHVMTFSYVDTDGKARKLEKDFKVKGYTLVDAGSMANSSLQGDSGFIANITQISIGQTEKQSLHGNRTANAEKAFTGWGLDPVYEEPYLNEADIDSEEGWSYYPVWVETVNQNQDAPSPVGNFSTDNGYEDEPIPGIPGWLGETDGIVGEFIALLDLAKGSYTFGVNSDDGFKATIGANFNDILSQEIGGFDGGRGAADTKFDFYVAEAGLYPYRVLWYEGGGGANIELFSMVDIDGKATKVLLNDPDVEGAIMAYLIKGFETDFSTTERVSTGRAAVVSVMPTPGQKRVESASSIEVVIENGPTTTMDQASAKMTLNGEEVAVDVSKSGDIVTISHTPDGILATGANTAIVSFNESNGNVRSGQWSFDVKDPTTGLADISKPEDAVVPTSDNSPGAEQALSAIDNDDTTKYLNFDKLDTGLTITTSGGVVAGLGLTSANDAPDRDPASFVLSGSNDGGATFTEIASGDVPVFGERFERKTVSFANDASYTTYQLIFPTVANSAGANSMQIAEIELLGTVATAMAVPGLIAYWPFDGDLDDAVGDSHGTGMGSDQIEFVSGQFGDGIALDGIDQFVEIAAENEEMFDFQDGTGFSISAWFTVDSFSKNWQALIAKGEGNRWRVHRRGGENVFTANGGNADVSQGTTDVSDGGIHHIALVSDPDGGEVRFYVDGQLEGTSGAPAIESNDNPMMIGENPDARNRTWHGMIDDVGVWDRPITEEEIALIYNGGDGTPLVSAVDAPVIAYQAPEGGWAYSLNAGDISAWNHDNGSDQWDGSALGEEFGDDNRPGGVSLLDGYIRLQDTGDPRDYGYSDPGSNRKIYLGQDISDKGGSDTILDDGATIHFIARIPTHGPLDLLHPDGGGGEEDYPAGGDGYENHDGGKGNIGIKQGAGGNISFSLNEAGKVLITEDGTEFELSTTEWHEFWVTIEKSDGGHTVSVYLDGSTEANVFTVTAGGGSDFAGSYLAMGVGSTGKSGSLDVAAFNFSPEVKMPGGGEPTPEQPTISVVSNGDGTVTVTFDGTLQSAPAVNGPWSDVDATSPLTIPADQPAIFARAKK